LRNNQGGKRKWVKVKKKTIRAGGRETPSKKSVEKRRARGKMAGCNKGAKSAKGGPEAAHLRNHCEKKRVLLQAKKPCERKGVGWPKKKKNA